MPGEGAARLRHLHQAEHPFIHARSARRRDDDYRATVRRPILNRTRDPFADDGTHGRSQEREIHHRDGDFVTFEHSVAAQDRVHQASRVLVFFQAILVGRTPWN
jgi:hypothetical protein